MNTSTVAQPTQVSGLVATLNPLRISETLATIEAHPEITIGKLENGYLPLTVEADDLRDAHRWLEEQPGVTYVDVVFCTTLSTH